MPDRISLQRAEADAFRAVHNDGLWDILLASFLAIFAGAPLLTARLGDFWSSAVFLPFWALVYLGLRLIRRRLVLPRVGLVEFGRARKRKIARITRIMLVVNLAALVAGIVVALRFGGGSGRVGVLAGGLILLAGFSVAAWLLGFRRLYVYGLLVGFAPIVGEWLYLHAGVSHHGFPVTFGATAAIIFIVGVALLARILSHDPISPEGA